MTELTQTYTAGRDASAEMEYMLRVVGLHYVREYRFAPQRRWRFDFADPDHKVALEINGGHWGQGRHTRPAALIREYEKLNAAQMDGWIVLLVVPEQVFSGHALTLWEQAVNLRESEDKMPY